MNFGPIIYELSVWALPVIVAVTFHEVAHGLVAHWFGDDTAWMLGRVNFNPLRHIDPFGTIVMPAILWFAGGFIFGYAKPVPVNFGQLRKPKRDMIWVAAAGPGMNMLLAFVSGLLLNVAVFAPVYFRNWLLLNLDDSIQINIMLAVFNMLPLPPLDGGRVLVGLLPLKLARPFSRIERYGILILLALIFLLPMLGRNLGIDLNVVSWALSDPVNWLYRAMRWVTGTYSMTEI
ncbi:MAG TPA: site-2 protease family protein [Alphaproteobacteria bacterium]|nr:site-2 protease family protein [Alphaproteobacteria bacterium]